MKLAEIESELKAMKDEKYHLLKLINHDIRSPFNRLYALLQLFELDSEKISPQQTEYLNSMYLSILSGLEMIQNLRDMRDIDAGNVQISNTDIRVDEIVQNAVRAFSKQLEIKNITVKVESLEDCSVILADSYYLQRIIENVLSNAVKFSRLGKEIWIRGYGSATEYNIAITDSGEGVKKDEANLLFQKFKKLSSFATGGEGSLGLGLHNAMSFAKLMNANISLRSEVQQGASFVIALPVDKAAI
jgi:K+-sensing histidine kinase KdpD